MSPRTAHPIVFGLAFVVTVVLISGCAVSPEMQAKMDEYERTIPVCSTPMSCETKWLTARSWTLQNADFPIYSESDVRIRATSTQSTTSGVGIVVHREPRGEGFEFLVDVECFTAYGCPNIWDLKLDFNRVVGAAGN